ncbi:hypothetical protein MUN74_13555 [Agromyces endophyticus]|uniref:hypothetical protein n=1 Tax=Agromyces sp. H17E-10 TaxID=2932244 RepID=UPI001FD069EE|nr:hypothetical protein [Agromyces sp. H17E-10]UOQ88302.1 hypothetical protein MUN74_13555 [Agromyces sp. H17E-10]
MDALEYARVVQKHVLVRDPDGVERVLIGEAPAYAERLHEIAGRVRVDPADVLPFAMVLLAVAAIGCAIAALPTRRADPPGPAVAFTIGVFAMLSALTMWLSAPVALGIEPRLAPWFWLGAVATLTTATIAVACMIARRRLPRDVEREAVVDEFRARVQVELRSVRERAEGEAAAAYALLEPEQRASLERAQLAARAELQRRGIPVPAQVPTPPGSGIVRQAVDLGIVASGAATVER